MKRRRVDISEAVARQLRELRKKAQIMGRGDEFMKALRFILEALHVMPLPPASTAFGCPQYQLPHLRLLVCGAVVAPLAVCFATPSDLVRQNGANLRPVFVMRFDLLQ
jgi:hypothetical protein